MGAVATLFAGQDVGVGIATASIAINNNFMKMVITEVGSAIVGLLATSTGGLLAKKQIEEALQGSAREVAPEDVKWTDQGVSTEEAKPKVLATPETDPLPQNPGYEAGPYDLLQGWLEGFSAYDGPDIGVLTKDGEIERKVRIPGLTGKEGAKNVPSWAAGERPYVGESGKEFAKRLCDDKYGKDNYDKRRPGGDYNKIKKWGDRAFMDPQ